VLTRFPDCNTFRPIGHRQRGNQYRERRVRERRRSLTVVRVHGAEESPGWQLLRPETLSKVAALVGQRWAASVGISHSEGFVPPINRESSVTHDRCGFIAHSSPGRRNEPGIFGIPKGGRRNISAGEPSALEIA